jgi:hypothetical protein
MNEPNNNQNPEFQDESGLEFMKAVMHSLKYAIQGHTDLPIVHFCATRDRAIPVFILPTTKDDHVLIETVVYLLRMLSDPNAPDRINKAVAGFREEIAKLEDYQRPETESKPESKPTFTILEN